MKNQGGKKPANANTKLEFRELIPYFANLTGLFMFSGVNSKGKSRHQW